MLPGPPRGQHSAAHRQAAGSGHSQPRCGAPPARRAPGQPARLRRVDDGGKLRHAVHAQVGDGEGAAAELLGPQAALLGLREREGVAAGQCAAVGGGQVEWPAWRGAARLQPRTPEEIAGEQQGQAEHTAWGTTCRLLLLLRRRRRRRRQQQQQAGRSQEPAGRHAHPPRQLLDLCGDGGQALAVRVPHDGHHQARGRLRGVARQTGAALRMGVSACLARGEGPAGGVPSAAVPPPGRLPRPAANSWPAGARTCTATLQSTLWYCRMKSPIQLALTSGTRRSASADACAGAARGGGRGAGGWAGGLGWRSLARSPHPRPAVGRIQASRRSSAALHHTLHCPMHPPTPP